MAKTKKTQVFETALALKKRDSGRDRMFNAMDTMFHNKALPPKDLASRDWFRWNPTTTPSDAVWGATRVLSAIEPEITYAPVSYTTADVERADKIERVLKSLYKQAGQRSMSKHTRQIVWNAVLYDSVAIQLDYLPFNQKKRFMAGTKDRLSDSRRFGPFSVNVRNAKNVHTVHSEWGLETVLYEQVLPMREVINFWGKDKTKELSDMLGDGNNGMEWVYVLDYWDSETRAVWAHPMESSKNSFDDAVGNSKIWIVPPTKHGMPFIPWVTKGGGSTTESAPELHHRPLLASIYQSKQFNTMNVLRSLIFSDEVAKFGEEDTVEETIDGDGARTSKTVKNKQGPRNKYELQVGEKVYRLPQTDLDTGLLELHGIIQNDMSASTVSRILLGDVPNDIAFSTLNLGQQSAARSIIPYQEVAQDALAEMFTQMLMWAKFAKDPLTALIPLAKGGRELYEIKPNEFDVDTILIDVKLVPDVPADQASKVNASAMAYERFGVSRAWAMENIGIADTSLIESQRFQEDLMAVEKQNAMNSLSDEFQQGLIDMVRQQVMAELAEKAKAEEKQKAAQEGQGGVEPGEDLTQGPGIEGIEGEGFSGGEGGSNTAQFAPGQGREQQQGVDRGGNSV